MTQRAVDLQTAQEVCTAVELAKTGACASLIENASGFGPRWVRGVVKSNGGVLSRKLRDPARWLDVRRRLHAQLFMREYESRPVDLPHSKKLLAAYHIYREYCPAPHWLDINECAQIVDLYRGRVLWRKVCPSCNHQHLVHSDSTSCYVCRNRLRTFCGVCGVQLPASSSRPRMYCAEHSVRATRVSVKRRTKRTLVMPRGTRGPSLVSAT